jgi:hypothetical protein
VPILSIKQTLPRSGDTAMAGSPSVGVLFTIGNCRNSEPNASAVQSSLLIFRTSLHHGEDSAELQVFIGNLRACVSLRSFYII